MKVQNKVTKEVLTFLSANDSGYEVFNDDGVISTIDSKSVTFIFEPTEEQMMHLVADLAQEEGF